MRGAWLAVAGLLTIARAASAETATSLEDARACTALRGGGYAVATGGGLGIVRGGETRVLTALDGLPDTRVHAILEAPEGLWVGTEGGAALVALDGRVLRTALEVPVRAVHRTSEGAVWLGTWGAGLRRLGRVEPIPGGATKVSALAEHDGALWAAFADGPAARLEGEMLRPLAGSPTHGQALGSSGGNLLLGDLEGLFRVDGGRARPIGSMDARAIFGGLVGTYGEGLWRGGEREAAVPRSVQGLGPRCAATTEGLFVDEGGWRRIPPPPGPPSNDVTALAVNGERVAVATFDAGVAVAHRGAYTRVVGLALGETVHAASWQGDALWLGTTRGLARVEGGRVVGRVRVGLPSPAVHAILPLGAGRLIVGTEDGPAKVEGGRATPLVMKVKGEHASLASPMHATWALARDAQGTLYVGTSRGLYVGAGDRWERRSVATRALTDDWVTAIAVGARSVFVGTYSGGVTELVGDRATHLGGGYVNPDGLVVHRGTLFAATMDGLLAREGATWKTLPSTGRDVTAVRFVGDARWVASRRGIAITR